MRKTQWLPWAELMAFGFGRLRLSSKQFWEMTLREMDAAIEGYLGKIASREKPNRDGLDLLMTQYPDNNLDHKNE